MECCVDGQVGVGIGMTLGLGLSWLAAELFGLAEKVKEALSSEITAQMKEKEEEK